MSFEFPTIEEKVPASRRCVVALACALFQAVMPAMVHGQLAPETKSIGLGTMIAGAVPYATVVEGPDGALYGTTRRGGPPLPSAPQGWGILFKLTKDGRDFRVIHAFGHEADDGRSPTYGALMVGTNGLLYGTTDLGGNTNSGTIYRFHPNGSGYKVVFHFRPEPEVGTTPRCRLVLGDDGRLYGTTQGALYPDRGTIFRIDHEGSNFQLLRRADLNQSPVGHGNLHQAGVIKGSDGWLYGTTETGGDTNTQPGGVLGLGTVYRLRQDGSDYEILHRFQGDPSSDGMNPRCALFEASDGRLYGTTTSGGDLSALPSNGIVFGMNRDGSGYEVLHRFFNSSSGSTPYCDLIEGFDGALYGQSFDGPGIFRLNKDGTGFAFIAESGGGPAGLTLASDGRFYGTTLQGVFGVDQDGHEFEWLVRFQPFNPASVERQPRAPLLITSAGLVLGTTELGGSGGSSTNGTVFVLTDGPNVARVLASVGSIEPAGRQPNGLVEGTDQFIYGTTVAGGSQNLGVIFRLDATGRGLAYLHHFGATGDGRIPRAGLVSGGDGFLYGACYQGGTFGRGTIFRIREDGGDYTTLRHLGVSMPDGQAVQAALVIGPDGALYGVANSGGSANRGTVFRLERDGSDYAILRHFAGGTDGANSQTPLLLGSDGFLYGATISGGNGSGTIYRLRPNGNDYEVIHRLLGGAEGSGPRGPLIEKPRGMLWGCTSSGGTNSGGTLFRARMDGTDYQVSWRFGATVTDGKSPFGGLILDARGHAVGTTSAGGSLGYGTVFRFDPEAFVLRIETVGPNAVVTWERGIGDDEVETAVSWMDGQPIWESHGAEVETIGNLRRSVVPLGAVDQLLFRVKRGP